MSEGPLIHFVVAMPCEAQPLVEHYGMRAVANAESFRVYKGESCRLIVSGVGKASARSATAYLDRLCGKGRNRAWINVGVAGHAKRGIGEAVLAHKITEQSTGKSWYPPLVFAPPCDTEEVVSVDEVQEGYPTTGVCEMEAAGFWPAACRRSTAELVHAFKVISDNAENPSRLLTLKKIGELVESRLPEIDGLVEKVTDLATELDAIGGASPELSRFLERWQFTVSQERQLHRLLQRWHALLPNEEVWCQELAGLPRAGDVLRFLERRADAQPLRF